MSAEQIRDHVAEAARSAESFAALAELRAEAQTARLAYHAALAAMAELSQDLRGVEMRITGTLRGRGGARVYPDEPQSRVHGLPIRIGSAAVETFEGLSDAKATALLPFLTITAWTLEKNELVTAWLGVGESGVTAELLHAAEDAGPVST